MRRRFLLLGVAVTTVLVAGLVALAAAPTGSPTLRGVLDGHGRIAARGDVGASPVLLVADGSKRSLLVAYRTGKGWFGVDVDPPPDDARTAWTATRGAGRIPPMSAVYGTSEGALVRVTWADGRTSDAEVALDGSWLVARRGVVRATRIVALAADGTMVSEEAGP